MTEIIDRSVLAGLADALGEDFTSELIDTFIEEAPGMFAEMRQALSAGDADSFRRAAHSLKTNAATFGATELTEKAKELEHMARENNLNIENKLDLLDDAYKQAAEKLNSFK